jgi:hypothetical protein
MVETMKSQTQTKEATMLSYSELLNSSDLSTVRAQTYAEISALTRLIKAGGKGLKSRRAHLRELERQMRAIEMAEAHQWLAR